MNDYQTKRAERIERLRERAEKKAAAANGHLNTVSKMADTMAGSPILIGYHSEKRHRRDAERMDSLMSRSVAEQRAAAELERRADAAERNNAISSDDPDAPDALRAKLAKLEQLRADMVRINRQYRKGGVATVTGLSSDQLDKIAAAMADKSMGQRRAPFEAYQLTNLGGRIRATKERIAVLEAKRAVPSSEEIIGDVKIRDDADENRVQIVFPGKPETTTRIALREHGFRWAPSLGVWQRNRGASALAAARRIVKQATGNEVVE
jgi:hypothetical protein